METAQINYSSSFSWRRVGMIARYYYPSLKWQMIIYSLASALFGIITYIATEGTVNVYTIGFFSVLVMAVIGSVQPFMVYFAPGFFVKSCRDVDVAIPALWSEKATFVMLYLFVGVPILVSVPGIICSALTQLIVDPSSFEVLLTHTTDTMTMAGSPLSLQIGSPVNIISVASIASYLPLSVFAFVLFRAPKPSFGKAALFSIIALVSSSLIAGIVIACYAIPDIINDETITTVSSGVLSELFNFYTIYLIICGLLSALFMWLTARSFKKIQL